jgi:hypothetical protein
MNIHVDADTTADQLLWPNVVRAFGQALSDAGQIEPRSFNSTIER